MILIECFQNNTSFISYDYKFLCNLVLLNVNFDRININICNKVPINSQPFFFSPTAPKGSKFEVLSNVKGQMTSWIGSVQVPSVPNIFNKGNSNAAEAQAPEGSGDGKTDSPTSGESVKGSPEHQKHDDDDNSRYKFLLLNNFVFFISITLFGYPPFYTYIMFFTHSLSLFCFTLTCFYGAYNFVMLVTAIY